MDNLAAVQVANMTPEQYDEWVKQHTNTETTPVTTVSTEKVVHRYNSDTYEYIGEYSLQPDPMNPGNFLYPPNITEVPPLPKDTTKRIFWDPIGNNWYYKEMIVGFDWYDKETGYKGFDVNENNVSNYVRTPPRAEGIMKFDSETSTWDYNYEELRNRYIQQLSSEKYKLLSQPFESSYGTFNSITDILPTIKEYLELLNDGIITTAEIRDYSNNMLELEFDDLKLLYSDIIFKREEILKAYWNKKDTIREYTLDELSSFFKIEEYITSSPIATASAKTITMFDDDNTIRAMLEHVKTHN